MSPGDRTRNKIDYILIQNRFRNSIKSSKSMPGADCDSDHAPVLCKLLVKLTKLKKPQLQTKFNIMKLKSDKEMKDQFVIEVKNRFDGLVELTEAEELFEKMKESLNEVMADKVPKMQKKQHKKWMTEEIINLMEDRRKAKSNIDLYKTLNTQIKDKCNEAKEKWINEQCKEIENNLTVDSKYMHSKIKDIKGTKGCTASNCIKAKDGNLLMEREDVLNRWSEYIEDLFQDDRGEKPIIKKDMDGPPILKEEVSAAIRKMKHGKAVGPDNIPIEVFAVLEDIGIDFLTKLLNSIYDSGKIPKDLAKSVFIILPKIPGTMDCELYRTISLMSHLTKVLLRIIMARMRKSLRPEISQLQFGFVPDKSTRNAIFTLSMLAERCIEMQKDLYLCLIDYSKAFDKVRHEKLFNILEHLDIDGKGLRVIRNLYWDQSAAVRIGGELSEYTLIKRGVRQGCVMSPDLFNIYSEMILRNLENYPGVKINGENINNIRYADDTVLIADSEENLQRLLNITIEKSEEMGLTLNVKKTECMVISKKAIIPSCNLQSRGQQIKLVKKFKYLGYMITSDGKCITEIKKRIATAKDAFQKLSLILKNRNISMTTKFRVLKTYVWSTLTYGCECWTITSDIEKKIEAAEMWFIRRMLRISWAEKKTNVNVLREGNVQRSLLKTIRKRQMEFLGHVCRRRGLEFLSLTGKVEGKRDRGKQRITFLDSLCNSATGGQSKGLNFLKLSDDRDVWRGMVANVCSRSGT